MELRRSCVLDARFRGHDEAEPTAAAMSYWLLRSGFSFRRVEYLHPAVLGRVGLTRNFQVALAIARRGEVFRRDVEPLDQVPLHGLGAAVGKPLVIAFASLGIGMAGNDHGRVLHA